MESARISMRGPNWPSMPSTIKWDQVPPLSRSGRPAGVINVEVGPVEVGARWTNSSTLRSTIKNLVLRLVLSTCVSSGTRRARTAGSQLNFRLRVQCAPPIMRESIPSSDIYRTD